MSKNKETEITSIAQLPEEESVFPEGHIMNEWSYNTHSREADIHMDRSRETLDMINDNESDYYIPREWWPIGFQLGWMVEYVLGQPQPDNLRKRQRKGWQFTHESEIPQLKMELMNHEFDRNRSDGWIRMGGHILMKKPQAMYDQDQEGKRQQGEQVRKECEALTQYMSNGRDPRFVVENRQSYQPNHRMVRK